MYVSTCVYTRTNFSLLSFNIFYIYIYMYIYNKGLIDFISTHLTYISSLSRLLFTLLSCAYYVYHVEHIL